MSNVIRVALRRLPFRRTWPLLPLDVIVLCLATFISFELRFNWSIPQNYYTSFVAFLILRPVIHIAIFLAFHTYTRFWRYAGVQDVQAIILAVTCGSVVVKLVDVVTPNINLPNSIWVSTYLLTLVLVGGTRLALKVYGTRNRTVPRDPEGTSRSRVLVFGAGSDGSIVVREAQRELRHGWHIVGLIDDDKEKLGLKLHGKPVLGTRDDLPRVIEEKQVDTILIAMPSMERSELRELFDTLNECKVPVLIIPPFTRWAVQNLFTQVRPVEVEDLLRRDPLPVDVQKVGSYLKNATVMVTGAGGSIGSG